MTTLQPVLDEAREAAAGGPADRFMARLAERIGARAGVTAVFGQPIARGDLTIVPVARVRWGFGGGTGSGAEAAGSVLSESAVPARLRDHRGDRPARACPPGPPLMAATRSKAMIVGAAKSG